MGRIFLLLNVFRNTYTTFTFEYTEKQQFLTVTLCETTNGIFNCAKQFQVGNTHSAFTTQSKAHREEMLSFT